MPRNAVVRWICFVVNLLEACALAQQSDFKDRDPRLRAAAFFALFSDGRIVRVDPVQTRVEFSGGQNARKAWTCDGIVRRQEGVQRSRCFLTEDQTARSLAFQATVTVTSAKTAVVLKSEGEMLFYGDRLPDAALIPNWAPQLPSAQLADGWIAQSGEQETIDLTFRLPKESCIGHFRSSNPKSELGTSGNDVHWTIVEDGRMVRVDVEASAGELCHIKGSRTPKRR